MRDGVKDGGLRTKLKGLGRTGCSRQKSGKGRAAEAASTTNHFGKSRQVIARLDQASDGIHQAALDINSCESATANDWGLGLGRPIMGWAGPAMTPGADRWPRACGRLGAVQLRAAVRGFSGSFSRGGWWESGWCRMRRTGRAWRGSRSSNRRRVHGRFDKARAGPQTQADRQGVAGSIDQQRGNLRPAWDLGRGGRWWALALAGAGGR